MKRTSLKLILLILIITIIFVYLFWLYRKNVIESFYILSNPPDSCSKCSTPPCPTPPIPDKLKHMSKDQAKKYAENLISQQVNQSLTQILDGQKEIARIRAGGDDYSSNNPHANVNSFIIYHDSIYKIGKDKKIYQKFLNGGDWFLLCENYNPGGLFIFPLRDITIIKDKGQLYIYALYGTDLCKRSISDKNSFWYRQTDIDSFGSVNQLTNNRDTLFFLVGQTDNTYLISKEDPEEEIEDKQGLFGLSNSGVYYRSLTNPSTTILNEEVGPFKDSPERAMRTYTGLVSSVDQCSENCKSFRYFGIQKQNELKSQESQCFCDNNLAFSQRYGTSQCGKMGGYLCNFIYDRRVTDIQNFVISNNYRLVRHNIYSRSNSFYGLYEEDSEIIVVKKNENESTDDYDERFEFSVQFVDLFLTNNYLYGMGIDGFIYRKAILIDFFGTESKTWSRVTTRLPSTNSLKLDDNKKLSVYNNFVYALDNNIIKKHFIMGYEWISIDDNTYVNRYYTESPEKTINRIHQKTDRHDYLDFGEEEEPTDKLTVGINRSYIKLQDS